MLCLLIYLFSISLHLYFFISLSAISIDTVIGIRILRIFCYLNIPEKIQSLNKFLAQQTCKLRPRVLGWEFKVKSSGFNAQSLRLGFKRQYIPHSFASKTSHVYVNNASSPLFFTLIHYALTFAFQYADWWKENVSLTPNSILVRERKHAKDEC